MSRWLGGGLTPGPLSPSAGRMERGNPPQVDRVTEDHGVAEEALRATLPRDLGDGLLLRFAQADDIDAVVAFNQRIHDDWCGPWTRDLMSGQHPAAQASDFTIVEDTKGARIVSSQCLISNTWTYGGIPFGCGSR